MAERFLVIEYSPYSFVYSDRDHDLADFYGFATYETYDQFVLPYPIALKFSSKDRSKVHFNLGKVAILRMSAPMVTLTMGWQAMSDTFKADLRKILDVSRLKARISFDDGQTFLTGEFQTKIKASNLTGYHENHLAKIELSFLTQLTQDLLTKVFVQ